MNDVELIDEFLVYHHSTVTIKSRVFQVSDVNRNSERMFILGRLRASRGLASHARRKRDP